MCLFTCARMGLWEMFALVVDRCHLNKYYYYVHSDGVSNCLISVARERCLATLLFTLVTVNWIEARESA